MTITGAAMTNTGMVRQANEDCIVVGDWCEQRSMMEPQAFSISDRGKSLCLVADGMGGYNAGEQASQFVSRAVQERADAALDEAGIRDLLRGVNRELFAIAERCRELTGMGTTVAGLLFKADEVLWFNVGDSKIYRYRDAFLRQISVDDLPVAREGEAAGHGITQALGGASRFIDIAPHVGVEPRAPGWRYLMCSDGLTDVLSVEAMEGAMAYSDLEAVSRMMQEALAAGAPDNVSIVVVTVGENSESKREGTIDD